MSVIKVCKEIILSSWPAARVVDWDGMGYRKMVAGNLQERSKGKSRRGLYKQVSS